MRVDYYTDAATLDDVAAEWEQLHQNSETATIFNSPAWVNVWWKYFGRPEAFHLITVRRNNGELVGVVPFYNTPGRDAGPPRLRLVGGVDVSDYLDILTAPGYERAVVEHLLSIWVDSSCSCTIDLHAMPAASPTRDIVLEVATELGMDATAAVEDVCPVISLPDSWDAYLDALDRKDRHELRRKLRKAGQEALITWYTVEQRSDVAAELPTFFDLHAASGTDKADFMTPTMRAFFEEMAVTLADKGWLRLAVLLINGRPAASDLFFDVRDEFLIYNSGFDPTVSDRLSPGWMLHGYLIEYAISLGRRRFDFLRGDEEYKFRFGARPEPVYHLEVVRAAHRTPM